MTAPTLFTLEILPADEGDCMLLHWGADRHVGLIDGGPSKVYGETLRPRLLALRQHFGIETLPLAFVMVSHVDNDHILGVQRLIGDLRKEVVRDTPKEKRPIRITRLWHNAFTDFLGDIGASAAGNPNPAQAGAQNAPTPTQETRELTLLLAGHAEGRAIRDDHAVLLAAQEIQRLNAPFAPPGGSTLIMQTSPSVTTPVDGLRIRVIGPTEKELVKLKADYDRFLTEKKLAAPAALAAALSQDNSPTNLSSIVCLVELGGRLILLTGDALGDKILSGLENAGQLAGGHLEVDILKVPHHGSARNTKPAFFDTIHARTYVFSANGRHGNPDRQTIEWLIASREREEEYRMVFTYALKDIDAKRRELQTRDGSSWDESRDSLEVLLMRHKEEGYAFTWSEGRAVLDLGSIALTW